MYSQYRLRIVADKKMYDVTAIHYLADEWGFPRVFPRKEIDEKTWEPLNYLMDNEQDRVVLMEFTGFVDKNHTRIYTWDIMEDIDWSIWVVEKSDGLFYLTPEEMFGEKGHFDSRLDELLYDASLSELAIKTNVCEKHLLDL